MDTRPVVALDIDGVLNPFGGDVPSGYSEHAVLIPAADQPRSPFVTGDGQSDMVLIVRVNASLHGRWINRLIGRGVVGVWASTWGPRAANRHLAPLLGIPELPGLDFEADIEQEVFTLRLTSESTEWKRASLRHHYHGRPLVWIDDQALPHPDDGKRHGAPWRIVTPFPDDGLTHPQRQSVESWLRRYVTA